MKEPEGSTPSRFEDYLNVFKWLNSTVSKSCWHIVNASKTMMSWEISQYAIYFLLCFAVYMSLVLGFCFMNFQRLERIRVIQQVTFYLPKVTQFHYILQVVPLPHPDGRRSLGARYSLADSGSESTSESEEESEVSKDRLGRLPCSKMRNCYYVYVTNCVPVGKVEVEQMLYLCLMLSLEASCR